MTTVVLSVSFPFWLFLRAVVCV